MDQKETQTTYLSKYSYNRQIYCAKNDRIIEFQEIIQCTFKVEPKVQVFYQEKENYVVTVLTNLK